MHGRFLVVHLACDIQQRGLGVTPQLPKEGQRAPSGDRRDMSGV